jgi:hypothetical protein
MKSSCAFCLLLAGWLLAPGVAAGSRTGGPRKVALIVAVGSYPAAGGWQSTSAGNDAALLKNALALHGFLPEDITVLADGRATKAGIITALDALVAAARADDIVVIHFSAHGQQVFDDNGDEFDGFDEALVPYNAPKAYRENGYRGENHLRDDELGEKLHRLGERVGAGGSVLVTLDACHSGSGTRGGPPANARERAEVLAPPGYAPKRPGERPGRTGKNGCRALRARGEANETTRAPLVVISASGPHQLNYETFDDAGKTVGSLTFALSQVLANAGRLSCGVAFEEVKLAMRGITPAQRPKWKGAGTSVCSAAPWWCRSLTSYPSPRGTTSASRREPDARAPGHDPGPFTRRHADPGAAGGPVATGKVVASSPFHSTVVLDGAPANWRPGTLWGFIREQHFGGAQLSVKLDCNRAAPWPRWCGSGSWPCPSCN